MANILLVDDNEELLTMAGAFLRHAGHTVSQAGNGRLAMSLASKGAFDLVITDIIMPDKEGIETIIELRSKYPAMKIIAMSGGGDSMGASDVLSMARKLGASRSLTKPFSGRELVDAASAVLNGELVA